MPRSFRPCAHRLMTFEHSTTVAPARAERAPDDLLADARAAAAVRRRGRSAPGCRSCSRVAEVMPRSSARPISRSASSASGATPNVAVPSPMQNVLCRFFRACCSASGCSPVSSAQAERRRLVRTLVGGRQARLPPGEKARWPGSRAASTGWLLCPGRPDVSVNGLPVHGENPGSKRPRVPCALLAGGRPRGPPASRACATITSVDLSASARPMPALQARGARLEGQVGKQRYAGPGSRTPPIAPRSRHPSQHAPSVRRRHLRKTAPSAASSCRRSASSAVSDDASIVPRRRCRKSASNGASHSGPQRRRVKLANTSQR